MNPRHPVYVISKGRPKPTQCLTAVHLQRMGVPFRLVVEPQEADAYAATFGRRVLLELPFSNLGQGSIPARNWVWQHAIESGAERHWIMDDNIRGFYRFTDARRKRVTSGAIFAAAEDFVDRYANVPLAGLQYKMFVPDDRVFPPFLLNTRIYSCILIRNDCRHRWRGRYNEDTDLSLRVLKDGDCTILFHAFLADKIATMTIKGGNTDELYKQDAAFDGRLEMARSLQRQHPDVVRITRKWGRWQHYVDYRPFKANRLIRRPGVEIPAGVNEYGMRLAQRPAGGPPRTASRATSGAASPPCPPSP